MRIAAGALAVVLAAVLAGCGASAQDPIRRNIATYLTSVDRIERQLAGPLTTINTVDKQLTAGAGRRAAAVAAAGAASQERRLAAAAVQIRAVAARLRALPVPAPAAHLSALVVSLADRQANLAVQTHRLIAFIPGFSRGLQPLGPAVVALERVLAVNQASGAAAVQAVYGRKAAALRTFAATLHGILASLARLAPPDSSRPTYTAEQRSLRQMSAAATHLAGDLASGRTTGVAAVLQEFDRAAAIPGSKLAQTAELAAVRAYDRQVNELGALVGAADRERIRLARRYS